MIKYHIAISPSENPQIWCVRIKHRSWTPIQKGCSFPSIPWWGVFYIKNMILTNTTQSFPCWKMFFAIFLCSFGFAPSLQAIEHEPFLHHRGLPAFPGAISFGQAGGVWPQSDDRKAHFQVSWTCWHTGTFSLISIFSLSDSTGLEDWRKAPVQESCADNPLKSQRAIKYTEITLQLTCRSQLSANMLG